jgi:transcriptional regulator with XRE-family HTH domain
MASVQKAFGAKVRKQRLKLGLSQSELAELLDCYQPDVSDIEQGHHAPTIATVERIAKALKVPVKFFFNF